MAENAEYALLKEHRTELVVKMESDLVWFAWELNSTDFPVLSDELADTLTNPLSMLSHGDKAMLMANSLLKWVKLEPEGLIKFVRILRKKPVRFKVLIEKLDPSKFTVLCKLGANFKWN